MLPSGGKSMNKAEKNREMIYKALTDPKFRKQLQEKPALAIGVKKLSEDQKKEIRFVLATVKGIEVQIGALADELLCKNDGPCGIA